MRFILFIVTTALIVGCVSIPNIDRKILGEWIDCQKNPSFLEAYPGNGQHETFTGSFEFYEDGTLFVEGGDVLVPAMGGTYKILTRIFVPGDENYKPSVSGEVQIVLADANLLASYTFGEFWKGGPSLILITDEPPLDRYKYILCSPEADY